MKRRYRVLMRVGILAALGLAALALAVAAQELGPPSVIAVRGVANTVTNYDAVAVDPVHDYAYVLHGRAVSVFKGMAISETLSDFGSPLRVVADSQNGYAYVTQELNPEVWVLQGTEEVSGSPVNVGSRPGAIAVLTSTLPGAARAYVALPNAGQVAVLDGATEEAPRIAVGVEPVAIAANPADGRVYVANQGSRTISVIQGHTVEMTITLTLTPSALAIHPGTGYLYVSHSADDQLSIWQAGALQTTMHVTESGQIAVDPGSTLAYVLSSDTRDIGNRKGWVRVLDGTTLVREVPLADGPRAVAVDAAGGFAYVALGSGDTGAVTVLQGATLVETIPMGQTPRGVAVNPNLAGGGAYVPVHNRKVVIFGRTETYSTDPIGAGEGATLDCVGTHGLPIEVVVPVGAVPVEAGEVEVICSALPEADPSPYVWAGQAFRLRVYQGGVNLPDFIFAAPVTLTVAYGEAWLGGVREDNLELRAQTGGIAEQQWELMDITLVTRRPPDDEVVATILRPADHALVGERPTVYLPLMLRE